MNNTYFITGGTGSLGRELIPRVLQSDLDAEIVLLLRGRDPGEVSTRLASLSEFLRRCTDPASLGRVRAAAGDVTLPGLGLAVDASESLRRRVTHIIHAGASIRLNQPIEDARRINRLGTCETLTFAERCPNLRRFAHVSTAYVAGDRTGTIREDELREGQRFLNAYEQSKCEAEEIVRLRRGCLPISIFRPSIIVGDSTDGHTCNFGTLYHPLKLIARGLLREIPGDPRAPLDLVPVDYVADCIVRLTQAPPRECATYHVAAGLMGAVPVAELVSTVLTHCGRGIPVAPRFVRADLRQRAGGHELSCFFQYLSGSKNFDDSTLRRDLGARASCPAAREFLPRLLSFCESTRWGRELPWDRTSLAEAA